MCGAQRANESGVDSLMSPLRKRVQGQIAHSLSHFVTVYVLRFALLPLSYRFFSLSLPVGYLAIHSLRSITRPHPALHAHAPYTHTLQLVDNPETKSN